MEDEPGGPIDTDNPNKYLKNSSKETNIYPEKNGYICEIDTRNLGLIIMELGGGRKSTDHIDFAVGLTNIASIGEYVDTTNPICTILNNNNDDDYLNPIKQKFKIL